MDTITLSATRASIAMLIACLITTIGLWLIATILMAGLRPHSVNLRDDQSTKFQVCLIGTPSCLSLYPPPTTCLLSSLGRCSADGEFGLIDPASR
jgi:hypothetical protein